MKRHWTNEELAEHWILSSKELDLIGDSKTDHNLLGAACLLKYFQQEGRFPARDPGHPSHRHRASGPTTGSNPGEDYSLRLGRAHDQGPSRSHPHVSGCSRGHPGFRGGAGRVALKGGSWRSSGRRKPSSPPCTPGARSNGLTRLLPIASAAWCIPHCIVLTNGFAPRSCSSSPWRHGPGWMRCSPRVLRDTGAGRNGVCSGGSFR